MNPLGIKKPSPGFILKADASLAPLNNAQIEVRAIPDQDALEPFSGIARSNAPSGERRLSRGIFLFESSPWPFTGASSRAGHVVPR
jgi:hypothetical protein